MFDWGMSDCTIAMISGGSNSPVRVYHRLVTSGFHVVFPIQSNAGRTPQYALGSECFRVNMPLKTDWLAHRDVAIKVSVLFSNFMEMPLTLHIVTRLP